MSNIKYQIELSENQVRLIAQCLEDVSRFASGQCEMQNLISKTVENLPHNEQIETTQDVENLLNKVKNILLPNTLNNNSLGYNNSEFIGNTYQIYRTMLHKLAINNNWNNVYSSIALPSGNLETIKIIKI